MERDLAGLVYGCSCLSAFVIVPCFGQMVKYVNSHVFYEVLNLVHKSSLRRHCSGDDGQSVN
jgi:hypothetical protein